MGGALYASLLVAALPSCLGFLCPRGPELGKEMEPWAAAAVSPASA